MIKMLLSGCNGHMGRDTAKLCRNDAGIEVAAGVDVAGENDGGFPVYAAPALCLVPVDVAVDFSSPAALPGLLKYGQDTHTPLVLCTTGYSEEQAGLISAASGALPIFRSANMSVGVNVLLELVRRAACLLEGFDVEIVERHHNRKQDAPSGTALMLADAAASALPYEPEYVYERHSVRRPRENREIGISSIRGGSITGDHTVIFAGQDEVVELTHRAASREVFAAGAIRAAKFLAAVGKPGLYSMADIVG